ncbi:hypothetical protein [Aeromicrobium sp. A1-2]|uniref:hypothetical protein n=1 Tax=Aeromicrobium sp. A1-2 TaxID=2107713 RepID=UPI0013C2A84D|nr:hypothetical protein [Aeromicrobium sp. A1-2]
MTLPAAGQCIAQEVDDANDVVPDTQTAVPCTEPHVYEILAVVDIPTDFLAGRTDDEKLARRTELATTGDDSLPVRKKMSAQLAPSCEQAYRDASGAAELTVAGKSAEDVRLTPILNGASRWTTVTSPKLWLDGTTQLICSVRFAVPPTDDGPGPVAPVTSPNKDLVISSLLTEDFPDAYRGCTVSTTGPSKSTPCGSPHQQEYLWTVDMRAVYGKDFLKDSDLANGKVSDDELSMMKRACGEPLAQLGGSMGIERQVGIRRPKEASTTGPSLAINCLLETVDTSSSLGSEFVAF